MMSDSDTNDAAATSGPTKEALLEAIRVVEDPDVGMPLVDLGLIYDIRVDGGKVEVDMTLTSPACPYGPFLVNKVGEAAREVEGVEEVAVEVVWDPPWTTDMMPEEIRLDLGLD